jgi:hypothetical protein
MIKHSVLVSGLATGLALAMALLVVLAGSLVSRLLNYRATSEMTGGDVPGWLMTLGLLGVLALLPTYGAIGAARGGAASARSAAADGALSGAVVALPVTAFVVAPMLAIAYGILPFLTILFQPGPVEQDQAVRTLAAAIWDLMWGVPLWILGTIGLLACIGAAAGAVYYTVRRRIRDGRQQPEPPLQG